MKNVLLQAAVCSSVVTMASQLFSTTLTDYVVSADETRTVASGETLTIERLLKGEEPHSFTLGGAGNSYLYGPSTFNGVFTYTNDPKVNGSLYVYGDEPFGPASEINLHFKDATGGGGGTGAFHLGGRQFHNRFTIGVERRITLPCMRTSTRRTSSKALSRSIQTRLAG